MRRFSLLTLLILAACFATTDAAAQCVCGGCLGGSLDARTAYEVALLEQRAYRQVDYPARVRALRLDIEFSETRVETLKRMLKEYRPFTRFRQGSALSVTIEQTRLELLREEHLLRGLRERLADEHRYHSERLRLHAQRVQCTATRLAQSHFSPGDASIEIVVK